MDIAILIGGEGSRIKKISKRGHIKITKILKANEQVMLRQFIKKIF